MYLRTRLLFGIGTVTLVALAISVLIPLKSVGQDVGRETDASMQLARLLLDIQHAVAGAADGDQARRAAIEEIQRAGDLRHVKISLVDESGALLASNPSGDPQVGRLTRALLPATLPTALKYPLGFHDTPLGVLHVSSNPLSEFAEVEQRAGDDLLLLALTALVLGTAIHSMVRQGLRPIAQVQSALARLQGGDFDVRLPRFRLKDVDDICERFNQCAAAMQEAAEQRRSLNRRIIEAEEEERRRLARELHDELGQSLTAIKVDAAYIAREAGDGAPKIASSAHAIESLSSGIMELIRSMLARLRPHGLETVGLRETLEDLVNGWQARVSDRFRCSLAIRGDVRVLSPELNITVYRLIQECLTNAVRHSRARHVAISLAVGNGVAIPSSEASMTSHRGASAHGLSVSLDVEESGVEADSTELSTQGTGLLGMRERVEALGGVFRVGLNPGGGLSLHACMPAVVQPGPEPADA